MSAREKMPSWRGKKSGRREVCNQRIPPLCCLHSLVRMGILLLAFLTLLSAQDAHNQRLGFWVTNICNVFEEARVDIWGRNPRSVVGCNMTMICKYLNRTEYCKNSTNCTENSDYCDRRNTTNLAIQSCVGENCTLDVKNVVVREDTRTKCSVVVDFVNMTIDMAGKYRCTDLDSRDDNRVPAFQERTVEVGYVPVKPVNITLVYQPGKRGNISVLLDPVKTSDELNDDTTEWNIVQFKWDHDTLLSCKKSDSDAHCRKPNSQGRCQPCLIHLRRYNFGQYTSMGNIKNDVTLNIVVKNQFGMTSAVNIRTSLLEWVKPGPVKELGGRNEQSGHNSTSVLVRVAAPKEFDEDHFNATRNTQYSLRLEYSVSIVSEEEVCRRQPDSQRFYKEHEFCRNLDDDKKALEEACKLNVSCQWNIPHEFEWNSTKYGCHSNSTKGGLKLCFWTHSLPFADMPYNVTVRLKSRYYSDPVSNDNFTTGLTAPMDRPRLEENFVYCPPDPQFSNDSCSTCLVYFKEIPRVWRGGSILNYRLTLDLLNTSDISGSDVCRERSRVVHTEGLSNTFYVPNLATGGEYRITIVGENNQGTSPETVASMLVAPAGSSPIAPKSVVLEKGGENYQLFWEVDKEMPEKQNGSFFIHYCYASPLAAITSDLGNRSKEALLNLYCRTNMVTEQVPVKNTHSESFYDIKPYKDLTPAFFVSFVSDSGINSGLVGVDCFFAKDVDPDTASLKSIDNDSPKALVLKFNLACGSSIGEPYGQPKSYEVAWIESDSSGQCVSRGSRCDLLDSAKVELHAIQGSIKDVVVKHIPDLKPNTQYCVGVRMNKGNQWMCDLKKTVDSYEFNWGLALGVAVAVALLGLMLPTLFCARKRHKKLSVKFTKIDVFDLVKASPEDHIDIGRERDIEQDKSTTSLLGTQNPVFNSSSAESIPLQRQSASVSVESETEEQLHLNPCRGPGNAVRVNGSHLYPENDDDHSNDIEGEGTSEEEDASDEEDLSEEEEAEEEEGNANPFECRYQSQPSQQSQSDDNDSQTYNNNSNDNRYAGFGGGSSSSAVRTGSLEEEDEDEEEEDEKGELLDSEVEGNGEAMDNPVTVCEGQPVQQVKPDAGLNEALASCLDIDLDDIDVILAAHGISSLPSVTLLNPNTSKETRHGSDGVSEGEEDEEEDEDEEEEEDEEGELLDSEVEGDGEAMDNPVTVCEGQLVQHVKPDAGLNEAQASCFDIDLDDIDVILAAHGISSLPSVTLLNPNTPKETSHGSDGVSDKQRQQVLETAEEGNPVSVDPTKALDRVSCVQSHSNGEPATDTPAAGVNDSVDVLPEAANAKTQLAPQFAIAIKPTSGLGNAAPGKGTLIYSHSTKGSSAERNGSSTPASEQRAPYPGQKNSPVTGSNGVHKDIAKAAEKMQNLAVGDEEKYNRLNGVLGDELGGLGNAGLDILKLAADAQGEMDNKGSSVSNGTMLVGDVRNPGDQIGAGKIGSGTPKLNPNGTQVHTPLARSSSIPNGPSHSNTATKLGAKLFADSIENILVAAQGSQLGKTDLLSRRAPKAPPVRMFSESDRDSIYTSGFEESEGETDSAKDTDSSNGSNRNLSTIGRNDSSPKQTSCQLSTSSRSASSESSDDNDTQTHTEHKTLLNGGVKSGMEYENNKLLTKFKQNYCKVTKVKEETKL